jgi:hypothetical protein
VAFLVAGTLCLFELSTVGSQCYRALMFLVDCSAGTKGVHIIQLQSVSLAMQAGGKFQNARG